MQRDTRTALESAVFAAETIAILHMALWRYQKWLSKDRRIIAYAIGVGVILAAYWRYAIVTGQVRNAVHLTLIVAGAGMGDVAAYAWRIVERRLDWRLYPLSGGPEGRINVLDQIRAIIGH